MTRRPSPNSPYEYIAIPFAFAIQNPISGSVFVGGNDGLLRLSKDEKSREKVFELPSDVNVNPVVASVLDMLITTSDNIYILANYVLYYSSDNVNTWINKSSKVVGESLALATDGTLYAAG